MSCTSNKMHNYNTCYKEYFYLFQGWNITLFMALVHFLMHLSFYCCFFYTIFYLDFFSHKVYVYSWEMNWILLWNLSPKWQVAFSWFLFHVTSDLHHKPTEIKSTQFTYHGLTAYLFGKIYCRLCRVMQVGWSGNICSN